MSWCISINPSQTQIRSLGPKMFPTIKWHRANNCPHYLPYYGFTPVWFSTLTIRLVATHRKRLLLNQYGGPKEAFQLGKSASAWLTRGKYFPFSCDLRGSRHSGFTQWKVLSHQPYSYHFHRISSPVTWIANVLLMLFGKSKMKQNVYPLTKVYFDAFIGSLNVSVSKKRIPSYVRNLPGTYVTINN